MEGGGVPFDPSKSFRGIELIAVCDASRSRCAVDTTAERGGNGSYTSSPEYPCQEQAFPMCEPISTGCATIQLDLQGAMAHDTGQDATRRIDE